VIVIVIVIVDVCVDAPVMVAAGVSGNVPVILILPVDKQNLFLSLTGSPRNSPDRPREIAHLHGAVPAHASGHDHGGVHVQAHVHVHVNVLALVARPRERGVLGARRFREELLGFFGLGFAASAFGGWDEA
jgi:hypothetical protein